MSGCYLLSILFELTPGSNSQIYYRLNPNLGLNNVDLVDCFHIDRIEETVAKWLTELEGKKAVCDIAEKLVDLNTAPLESAEATHAVPPAPPPNTNPGYNPELDEPRPQKMVDYLKWAKYKYANYIIVLLTSILQEISRHFCRRRLGICMFSYQSICFPLIFYCYQMGFEGRWSEARDALAGIAEEAIKHDSDGVDLCFFNSKQKCLAIKV